MIKEQYFTKIVNSLSTGVALQDRNLQVLYCNEKAYTTIGLTESQLLGKTPYDPDWQCIHEDGSPFLGEDRPSVRALKEGVPIRDVIMGVMKPDKTFTWVSVNSEPIYETNTAMPDYVVTSFVDITPLKNKERALKESNEELERFAYVASHDLQEPLRKINTFLSLFISKNEKNIDEKGMTFLSKVTDSTHRMNNLINDLLEFSRSNNIKGKLEDVDCNAKINYIRDSYNLSPNDRKVIIHSEDLPMVKGYKTQLLALFQNMINNGIKYNQSEVAEIRIKCQKREKDYLFSIQDNGIGMEEEDFQKIFLPFHRLHGRSEYAGSGIGLATCKKIVEKHNGEIWLTSKVGEGTTFFFTLPVD